MLVRASVERPWRTLVVTAVITAALGGAATRLVPDDTPAAWLPRVDAELDAYRAFRARFGEDAFTLAVSAPANLDDPAVLAALADAVDRLRAVDGAGKVVSPVRRGDPVDALRAALPGRLDALRRAFERAEAQGSPWAAARADLLALQAEANAGLALLLLHDVDPASARACYGRAQQAATRLLLRVAPDAGHALLRAGPGVERGPDEAPAAAHERLQAALAAAPPEALPGLFWWAFARGAEVRLAPDEPLLLADLPRVDAVMAHVLERDEGLFHGGPHLYFALRLAAPPALGGDLERSAAHFEAARGLSHGQDLMAWVLEAEHLAPLLAATPAGAPLDDVLAAQRRAWRRFTDVLTQVQLAPPDLDGAHPEANAVARARARALLADPAAHGVIPPADAAAPALDASGPTAYLADGPLERFLVSDDRRQVALLVAPRADLAGPARAAVVDRVEAALVGSPVGPFRLVGPEVMTHDLDHASQASFRTLFPLTFGLMCLVLAASLRSLRAVVAIQAGVGATVLWTLGLLALTGRTLNMVLVVLPAMLSVVGTAYALHLVSRFLDRDPDAPDAPGPAWVHAARETALPCLLAALTTAGGFAALATSEIPPVRDLGLFAAAGVLIAFVLSFTLVPAALSIGAGRLRPGARPSPAWSEPATARYVRRLGRLALPALVLTAAVGVVAARGLSDLRVESDVLRFFPPEHRLPAGTAAVEEGGIGLTPLELWLEGPAERVLAPATLGALRAFLAEAAREPLVLRTVSPLSAPGLEGRPDPVAGALLMAAVDRGEGRPALVMTGDALAVRVTLACRTTATSDACDALARRLREALPRAGFPPGVALRLTGVVPLLVRVQVLLVDTQTRSFAWSLAAVTVVLLLAFRSLGLALLSVVPNAVPVLVTLGGMGLVGLPLDTATVTVAAIALGLLVDDTIHLLHHLRGRPRGTSLAAALPRALALTGRPIVATTLTIAVGFGAFVLSPFRPTRDFGALIALTSVSALLCVLVVVPAIVVIFDRLRGGTSADARRDRA